MLCPYDPACGALAALLGRIAPLGHELVDTERSFASAEPLEEIAKFPLLLFETAQGLLAILVECAVAPMCPYRRSRPLRPPPKRFILRSNFSCHALCQRPSFRYPHPMRPLQEEKPETRRPAGQNTMKLATMRAIQAGRPRSSIFMIMSVHLSLVLVLRVLACVGVLCRGRM